MARRCELFPAQQAAAVTRRKEIYEVLHPETKATYAGGAFKGNQHEVAAKNAATSFTAATAKATGKAERTIRLAVARGKALEDDLDDIAGTSLDNKSDLDALAKMSKEERKTIIERAKAGERVRARKEPKVPDDPLSDELASAKQVARLMDA